jgi:hypothetical protein
MKGAESGISEKEKDGADHMVDPKPQADESDDIYIATDR